MRTIAFWMNVSAHFDIRFRFLKFFALSLFHWNCTLLVSTGTQINGLLRENLCYYYTFIKMQSVFSSTENRKTNLSMAANKSSSSLNIFIYRYESAISWSKVISSQYEFVVLQFLLGRKSTPIHLLFLRDSKILRPKTQKRSKNYTFKWINWSREHVANRNKNKTNISKWKHRGERGTSSAT